MPEHFGALNTVWDGLSLTWDDEIFVNTESTFRLFAVSGQHAVEILQIAIMFALKQNAISCIIHTLDTLCILYQIFLHYIVYQLVIELI